MSEKSESIIQYQREHPEATGAEIARVHGVTRAYASLILSGARKAGTLPPVQRGRRGLSQQQEFPGADEYHALIGTRAPDEGETPDFQTALTQIRALRDYHLGKAQRYAEALKLLEGE
jgi:hypothetical protein